MLFRVRKLLIFGKACISVPEFGCGDEILLFGHTSALDFAKYSASAHMEGKFVTLKGISQTTQNR